MSNIPHLPVLRLGRAYESLEKIEVKDHRTGEVRAFVSTVNGGIVKRDLAKIGSSRAALKKFTVKQLIAMSAQAGEWDKVTDKKWEAAGMEVYAAMVDRMDQGIGKLIAELKRTGQFENTLVLFLQDNGGCAEAQGRTGNKEHPNIERY